MKPYYTISLIDYPDNRDLQTQARSGHVGHLPRPSGDFRPSIRSAAARRSIRRHLKRKDKQRLDRYFRETEDW